MPESMGVYTLRAIVPWIVLIVGLIITASTDPYISLRNKRMISMICGLVFLLIYFESMEYMISESEPQDFLRACASAAGYTIRPVLLVLFYSIVYPRRKKWPLWLLTGVNGAVYVSSIFTGIAFSIVNNAFRRGPLNRLCLIVSAFLILYLTIHLIRSSVQHANKNSFQYLFAGAIIILGTIMDGAVGQLHPINFLTIAIIISIFFYYLWLHIQLSRIHEEKSIQNLQAEHRIELMVSQIQPHFIFNTLTVIQALCETDPQKAGELTERFGKYLRENLNSINRTSLIPFRKEMQHTQEYVEIEQVRFPNIHVTYDLQDMQFQIPALTVQPIVENAIRHGVRIRENGEIHIRSWRENGIHMVEVHDNGKGFDVNAAFIAGSQHIGLRNVRERVQQMCKGTMEITSTIGEGATVVFKIPVGKEQR